MINCTCGGDIFDGDPNGPICSNTGRFVSACTAGVIELRAQITLIEPELEDICEIDLGEAIDVSQEAAECDTY